MRKLVTYLLLAVALSVSALCADVVVTAVRAQDKKPAPVRIPCRAHYQPLTPYELVGFDECGHMWKLILPQQMRPHPANPEQGREDEKLMGQNATDEPICCYWDLDSGSFVTFPCPAPGEQTGEIELEPGQVQ